jgi:hypothetical protein
VKLDFPVVNDIKADFLNACARWNVYDYQPFHVGNSNLFKATINKASPKIVTPDAKTLKRKLQIQKEMATATMKIFL